MNYWHHDPKWHFPWVVHVSPKKPDTVEIVGLPEQAKEFLELMARIKKQ